MHTLYYYHMIIYFVGEIRKLLKDTPGYLIELKCNHVMYITNQPRIL